MRGHKCACLFYLEVMDDDGTDGDTVEPADQPAFEEQPPLISLTAITRIREDTMQIRLSVGEHEFTALINTGSTHNFISTTTARRASLNFHSSHGAHVVVANGDQVACRGLAHDVGIRITQDRVGHTDFSIDYYSIPLDC